MRLIAQIEIDKTLDLETTKHKVSVGRAKDNELVLAHKSISRNHCIIEEDKKGNFFITDLGSSNGTFINDKKITPKKRVPLDGGYLTIGRVECELRNSKNANKTLAGEIIHSALTENGDATATLRISRLELNRPSLTLQNEKNIKVPGPRNPISSRIESEGARPVRKSIRGFLFFMFFLALIAAWYLGEHDI